MAFPELPLNVHHVHYLPLKTHEPFTLIKHTKLKAIVTISILHYTQKSSQSKGIQHFSLGQTAHFEPQMTLARRSS